MRVKANEKTGTAKAARLLQAKYRALSLLDRCLTAHNLDVKEHEGIISGTFLYRECGGESMMYASQFWQL